jgi:hypothetical protein
MSTVADKKAEGILMSHRGSWRVIAVLVAALCLGLVAGFGKLALPASRTAHAATHCTNYAPIGYQKDVQCNTYNWFNQNQSGTTCCTGLRDQNIIAVNANRTLEVWYAEGYGYALAYGTVLSIGASSGYMTASCKMNGYGVYGRCRTNWHD